MAGYGNYDMKGLQDRYGAAGNMGMVAGAGVGMGGGGGGGMDGAYGGGGNEGDGFRRGRPLHRSMSYPYTREIEIGLRGGGGGGLVHYHSMSWGTNLAYSVPRTGDGLWEFGCKVRCHAPDGDPAAEGESVEARTELYHRCRLDSPWTSRLRA